MNNVVRGNPAQSFEYGVRRLARSHGTRRRAKRTRFLGVCLVSVCGLANPSQVGSQPPEAATQPTAASSTNSPSNGPPIDELKATAEQLQAQLGALNAAFTAALDQHTASVVTADAARVAVENARLAESEAAIRAAELRSDVVDAVVVAYTGHSADADLGLFGTDDVEEAAQRTTFRQWEADRRVGLADAHEQSRLVLVDQRAKTEAAAVAAEAAEAAAAEQLLKVEQARQQQQALVDATELRLEDALSEAAALAAIDAQVAAELAAKEQSLRDSAEASVAVPVPEKRLPVAPPATAAPTTPKAPAATTTAPKNPASPTTRPVTPPTTPPSTQAPPTTLGPPVTLPPPVELVVIRGITVARQIGPATEKLLQAASDAGLQLSGSGYRDSSAQVALRKANCGPTDFDIWEKPASQCRPPTARPGKSMHEQGLALDLTCSGKLITAHSNPCFEWLEANAAGFGFFNLPSEPWHWSTNGN